MELKTTGKNVVASRNDWELQKRVQPMKAPVVHDEKEAEPKLQNSTLATKILDIIISVSFGALFFGLPLFFLNKTFQGVIFEKQLYFYFWVLVAIVSWITKSVVEGELKIKETPLDYFLGFFTFAYLLSTIFSVDRWHSFFGFFGDQSRGLINVLAMVLVYYFIFSNVTKKRLVISLSGIIASAAIVQTWTIAGLFFADKMPTWLINSVPGNLFGSITSIGIFLSCIFPLFVVAIYKLSESKLAKKTKILLTTLTSLFLLESVVLIWFIYSFVFFAGAFPGLVVGISFFVIFIISLIVRPKAGWAWVSILAFMIVLVLLMIGGGESFLAQKLPAEVSPSYGFSWNIAKNAMKENFFIGSGSALYSYDFSKYRSQELNSTQFFNLRFYQGSGLFFESLPTIGFLGTAVGILILLSYLGTSIYLLCRDKEKNKMYSLGFFSAGVAFLYSALIIRIDGSVLVFGLLIVILSLAALQLESANEERYRMLSLKTSPKYALALAFIFMLASGGVAYVFVFMGKALVADMYMKKATAANVTRSEEGSVSQMIKAINLYPNESRYYTRAGQEYMVLANNEALKGKEQQSVETIQQYLNNAIFLSNKAKDLSPNDVVAVESLAQVYENSVMFIDKSAQLAEQYYKRASELEPHNPVYYVKLGEMKIAQASSIEDAAQKKQLIQESIPLFQKSVDEKKDYAIGYYDIAIASQASGDLDKAIENAAIAFAIENSNANYLFTEANFLRERGKDNDYIDAERAYKEIIGQDDSQYNVHLALGLLYEKLKKGDSAIAEYKKVLTILPDGSDNAKTQVNKMITNVQNGTGNLTSSSKAAVSETSQNVIQSQTSGQSAPAPAQLNSGQVSPITPSATDASSPQPLTPTSDTNSKP